MVLADHEIQRLCKQFGMITPFESAMVRQKKGHKPCLAYGLDSAGYDLRLRDTVRIFSADYVDPIDPKNFKEEGMIERSADKKTKAITLMPQTTALGVSIEKIKMPNNVWALFVAKSTYARCGVTLNATKIVPGWEGELVIEISNLTPRPVLLYPEEGIGSLIFFWVNPPDALYADRKGKYQGQRGVTLPKA